MGKATIISGGTGGFYSVYEHYENTGAAVLFDELTAHNVTLASRRGNS